MERCLHGTGTRCRDDGRVVTAELRTHRLGAGRTVAWVLTCLAIAAIVDTLLQRPVDRTGVAVLVASVVIIELSVLLGIRPVVQELPSGLMVRNPLRTTIIPWTALLDVRNEDVLVVDTEAGPVRCYALPRRLRRGVSMSSLGRTMPGATREWREVPSAVVQERLLTQSKALAVGQAPGRPVDVHLDLTGVVLTALVVVMLVVLVLLLRG